MLPQKKSSGSAEEGHVILETLWQMLAKLSQVGTATAAPL